MRGYNIFSVYISSHSMSSEPRASLRRMKQLYFWPAVQCRLPMDYHPYYYFEAKVDFNDVRSGYHETRSVNGAAAVSLPHDDAIWSADMLQPVDTERIMADPPAGARLGGLPHFVTEDLMVCVESRFVSHLMRHLKARFYRSYHLSSYSAAGESLADFAHRCLELLNDRFRGDLDALGEVLHRRLELIKEKFASEIEPDGIGTAGVTLRKREHLRNVTDRIDGLLLNAGLSAGPPETSGIPAIEPVSDLEEKLVELDAEARRGVARLIQTYLDRAGDIDEYELHPGLKDIHMARTCILWMPGVSSAS